MKIPTFPYPGGKARLASEIIKHFPKSGRMYVEPFVGRGNIFWRAATCLQFESWWLNDIKTHQFFLHLVNGKMCEVPERTPEQYYRLWSQLKQDPQNIEAILLEPYLTFSGGGYGSGGFGNLKGASRQGYANILQSAHRLTIAKSIKVTSLKWEDMNLSELSEDDFVYLDPPYATADVRCYKEDTIDFVKLIDLLRTAKFKWILSEYRQPAYVEAFGNPIWSKQVQLSVTNTKKTQENRVECLWGNL